MQDGTPYLRTLHLFFLLLKRRFFLFSFFFLKDPAPPEIYPFPLHDALPISRAASRAATASARSTRCAATSISTARLMPPRWASRDRSVVCACTTPISWSCSIWWRLTRLSKSTHNVPAVSPEEEKNETRHLCKRHRVRCRAVHHVHLFSQRRPRQGRRRNASAFGDRPPRSALAEEMNVVHRDRKSTRLNSSH